jgi:hypothetical protein
MSEGRRVEVAEAPCCAVEAAVDRAARLGKEGALSVDDGREYLAVGITEDAERGEQRGGGGRHATS